MSADELESLKQQVEESIQAKKQQRVKEAFQKISDLSDDDLRELIGLIRAHLEPKVEHLNPMDCYQNPAFLETISGIKS
jgi:hypothetical protein